MAYRTTAWLRRESERFYTARAHKAVAEFIRTSRRPVSHSFGTIHGRLVAAYEAGNPDKVAGLLTMNRAVDEAFDGGGGPNLVHANAVGYVKAYWQRIGKLLEKASARPRGATRANPSKRSPAGQWKWESDPGIPGVQAPLSFAKDYVISHRHKNFNVSFRPPGQHHHVGTYMTLAAAKRAAYEHDKTGKVQPRAW